MSSKWQAYSVFTTISWHPTARESENIIDSFVHKLPYVRRNKSRHVWMRQELLDLAVQDESSLAGHLGERAPRTADDEDEGADVAEEEAVDVPEDVDEAPSGDCKPSFSLFCSALLLPVEWTPQSLQDISSLLSVLETVSMADTSYKNEGVLSCRR